MKDKGFARQSSEDETEVESKDDSYLLNESLSHEKQTRGSRRAYGLCWSFSGYVIALCLAVYILIRETTSSWGARDPQRPHLLDPRLPGLNPSIHPHKLPITDWPTSPPSIYRQPPSPEVDAEWARISNVHNIAVPSSHILALGKDPLKTVKAPVSWDHGPDAHLALPTVLHQTHCLNRLRKAVYYDHYYRKGMGYGRLPPDDVRSHYFSHLDHCLHFLLETVTCVSDTSLTTYNWMENRTLPTADFQTNGVCRDFEAVVSWHAERHVDAGVPVEERKKRWAEFGPGEGDFVLPRMPRVGDGFWDEAIGR